MTNSLSPRYYLVHDTPTGTRYAYPLALLTLATPSYRTAPWGMGGAVTAEPAAAVFEVHGDWLISDTPLTLLRRERPGQRARDGWVKSTNLDIDGPVPPDLAAAFAAAPSQPSQDNIDHFAEHDAAHACWQCRVFSASYGPRYVAGEPIVETQDFADWAPLPGDLDPDPSREWQVNDTSLLAIYGTHTAHLWPGVLLGLREPVIERLKAQPLVSVQTWTHQTKVDLTITVPWETPRSRTEHYKPYGKRKSVPRTRPVFAIEKRTEVEIPNRLGANSKAEAIARFDDVVTREVERALPFGENPRGCDHCQGLGWVRGDA